MVVVTLQKTHSKAFHFIDVQSQMSFLGVLPLPPPDWACFSGKVPIGYDRIAG